MPPMRLLIRHATVITSRGHSPADVLIEGHRMHKVEDRIPSGRSTSVLDADGMYLLPGAIDPHVHMSFPFGRTTSADDFASGSRAALAGGTTTILDFALPKPGLPLGDAVEARKNQAHQETLVDFGLHCVVRNTPPQVLKEIPYLIAAGITSFKVFTTYDDEGLRVDPGDLIPLLQAVGAGGGLVTVHAEEPSIVNRATSDLVERGAREPRYHAAARPASAEAAMVALLIELGALTECPIYFHHVSTAPAADQIARAKSRGQRVYAETCPHYLLLDASAYEQEDAVNYVVSPPLRTALDQERLWDGLRDGTIDTVGTDHCPFTRAQKAWGATDFRRTPNGLPGVESRLSLMHMAGVVRGRISLSRWVEVCSTAPAAVFGLAHRKGDVRPGMDADLVVFDPNLRVRLSATTHRTNCDWEPYEGWEIVGAPVCTLRHGAIAWRDGRLVATERGRFVPRQPAFPVQDVAKEHS